MFEWLLPIYGYCLHLCVKICQNLTSKYVLWFPVFYWKGIFPCLYKVWNYSRTQFHYFLYAKCCNRTSVIKEHNVQSGSRKRWRRVTVRTTLLTLMEYRKDQWKYCVEICDTMLSDYQKKLKHILIGVNSMQKMIRDRQRLDMNKHSENTWFCFKECGF